MEMFGPHLIDFPGTTGRRHKLFGPRAVGSGHDVMDSFIKPAAVRDHGNVVGGGKRADPSELGQSTAPGNVWPPDACASVFQQLPKAVTSIFVFSRRDARGFDGRA